MRELTFAGFLKRYVRELSAGDTNSLYSLAGEAGHDNPRLREPLFLYAMFTGKEDVLLKAAKDESLRNAYRRMLEGYDKEDIRRALEADDPALGEAYRKVWRSYRGQKNRRETDDETKALMRKRILAMQKEMNVSNYRIYTDLGLNPGNLNAWLKHGESGKVSLSTARRALAYMAEQCR